MRTGESPEKTKRIAARPTEEQLAAIRERRRGQILLSAGAGTGKTQVLTDRILSLCLDDGIQAEDLAVMTFTEKAALNMKQRLEKKLDQRILQYGEDGLSEKRDQAIALREQLPRMQISTIHAFCLRLIRENQSLLPSLPERGFSILKEEEAGAMLDDAISEVLATLYEAIAAEEEGLPTSAFPIPALLPCGAEEQIASFKDFLDLHDADSSDRRLREELAQRHAFLRSLPDYPQRCREWLDDFSQYAEEPSQDPAVQAALSELEDVRQQARSLMSRWEDEPFFEILQSGELSTQDVIAFQAVYPQLSSYIQMDVLALSSEEQWQLATEMGQLLRGKTPLSKTAAKKLKEEKLRFRELFYRSCGPLIQYLSGDLGTRSIGREFGLDRLDSPFFLGFDEMREGNRRMLPLASRYLELLLEIDRHYGEKKQRMNRIDFSDFEHLAYRLIQTLRYPDPGDDQPKAAELPAYKEILIDEYQDTSPLQEALLQSLGCPCYTMVGDVKQSIYRFRHADPRIFNRKLNEFKAGGTFSNDKESEKEATAHLEAAADENVYLLLSKNFRSCEELIAIVNRIFSSFLTQKTGEIDYDGKQFLRAADGENRVQKRQIPGCENPALELRLSCRFKEDKDEDDEGETLPAGKGVWEETRLLAESPRSLQVLDAVLDLRKRGYAYGEIAVLCRTNQLCGEVLRTLEDGGIPAISASSSKTLDSPELRLLEQLCSCLDNQHQDYPLVAVLRSGISGDHFPEDDLLKIAREPIDEEEAQSLSRIEKERLRYFYGRFERYARQGRDEKLRRRCASFLEQIRAWREAVQWMSLSDLLRQIVEEHGWLEGLPELPFGEQRVRDVESFIGWAELYGDKGRPLSDFCRLMTRLRSEQVKIEDPNKAPESSTAVRIMSIHASKGLEFPAVIYPDASAEKRGKDRANLLFELQDPDGLAALYPGPGSSLILSPRYQYFRKNEDFRERAESFRLLYVCLTRAQETALVCASPSPRAAAFIRNDLKALLQSEGREKRREAVASARSDFALILAAMSEVEAQLRSDIREALERDSMEETDFPYHFESGAFRLIADSHEALCSGIGQKLALARRLDSEGEESPSQKGGTRAEAELYSASKRSRFFLPEPGDEEARQRLQDAVFFRTPVPHSNLLLAPGKLTVSEIKRQWQEEDQRLQTEEERSPEAEMPGEAPAEQPLYAGSPEEMLLQLRHPDDVLLASPLSEEKSKEAQSPSSPREYGIFLHQLFQDLPVEEFFDPSGQLLPEKQMRERYAAFIEEEIRLSAIPEPFRSEGLAAETFIFPFLRHSLGERLMRAIREGHTVRREAPFTLAIPALFSADPKLPEGGRASALKQPEEGEDISLLQGMIDLFFVEDGEVVLLDYKSDQLSGSREEKEGELRERYGLQLASYAEAIRRIYGRGVKEACVWLIREGRPVIFKGRQDV